jgi:hypothetical protein
MTDASRALAAQGGCHMVCADAAAWPGRSLGLFLPAPADCASCLAMHLSIGLRQLTALVALGMLGARNPSRRRAGGDASQSSPRS